MPFLSNVPEKGRDARRNRGEQKKKKKKAFMAAFILYVSNENKERQSKGNGLAPSRAPSHGPRPRPLSAELGRPAVSKPAPSENKAVTKD